MKKIRNKMSRILIVCTLTFLIVQISYIEGFGSDLNPVLQYSVSMPEPANHLFHVTLFCKGLKGDTIDFKMPRWMPGYYQIMDYSKRGKKFFSQLTLKASNIPFINPNSNTWKVIPGKNTSFSISYDVFSTRNFVASNYLDTTHGYIVPAATFMFIVDIWIIL